jgi:hypothetical protein
MSTRLYMKRELIDLTKFSHLLKPKTEKKHLKITPHYMLIIFNIFDL